MQFKSNLRHVIFLLFAQCLLLLNGYYNAILCLQFLIMGSILFDLFCRKTNESNSNRRSSFRYSSSYDLIHLRPSTTAQVLDDITFHLRSARKYTMTSKSNIEYEETMSLSIDASLPSRSLIIIIEYDHERDANTSYAATLHDLFKVIFERSKFILGWGDLRVELQRFLKFDLFTNTQLIQVRPIDIQQMFEEWHHHQSNRTDELVIDDDSKIVDSWSLSETIEFCFDQFLDNDDDFFGINQCFAIGKISEFIRNPTK